ncbi:hypothetical protein GSY69_09180 [Brevibacterium sp. 5221]|uniref:Uncharacterized protein n=1 Tax=Brevibacterium rongguiense TaxID=2695267 RepID=A0A6N9H9D1_9MICO|nr:hypothetical protein [Brevibacterium rongguiense]MYM20134.1 hypothetical protein [Brevibacterium rongguiense]
MSSPFSFPGSSGAGGGQFQPPPASPSNPFGDAAPPAAQPQGQGRPQAGSAPAGGQPGVFGQPQQPSAFAPPAGQQGQQGQQPEGGNFGVQRPAADLQVSKPPTAILFGVLGAAVLGVAIAVFLGTVAVGWGPATILGWLLAGPVAIVLLGVFASVDTRRRAEALYAVDPTARLLYGVCAVVCAAAVITTAILAAVWVGRL